MGRFLLLGLTLSVFYWACESLVHVYVFKRGSFTEQLFGLDPNELWMRVFIVAILLAYSLYAGIVVARLRQSREALGQSEEKYRRMVETAEEGIWAVDERSNTVFVNSRMAEMLGYTVEEMMGRSLFDFMDPDSVAYAGSRIDERRRGIKGNHDFKFRRRDGSDLWTIVSTTPVMDAAGGYRGTLAMVNDITERKKADQALAERLDELERFRKATVEREFRIRELKEKMARME
ncbi:MAG: PAS domain-containing protein [Thermodesulfobacteriota bacterium]